MSSRTNTKTYKTTRTKSFKTSDQFRAVYYTLSNSRKIFFYKVPNIQGNINSFFLCRKNTLFCCRLLPLKFCHMLVTHFWPHTVHNTAAATRTKNSSELTFVIGGDLTDGRSRHVMVEELSEHHQHQSVEVIPRVLVLMKGSTQLPGVRQLVAAASNPRLRYRYTTHQSH